jgi:hypothetical protein
MDKDTLMMTMADFLNRSTDIITALEGHIKHGTKEEYTNSDLQKSVDKLFNEMDTVQHDLINRDSWI